MEFHTEIFSLFDQKWGLLTAGNKEDFNTMTISWGSLGTMWGKPVATVYIRPAKLTYDYMVRNDYFTISFYVAEYLPLLGVLGSKSGSEMDKMKTGLHVKDLDHSITFEEAEVTLVCKKLLIQPLAVEDISDEDVKLYYEEDMAHDMCIGEVVEILKK